MDLLFKELELADMICESVEDSTLNQIYIESSIGDLTSSIGRNVKDAIEKIIQAFKDFIENIKQKIDHAKIMYRLKKLQKVSVKNIRGELHDRECIEAIKKLYSLQNKMISEIMKMHDAFMARKIDEDEFNRKVNVLEQKYEYEATLLVEKSNDLKIFDPRSEKAAYATDTIVRNTSAVIDYQQKILENIKDEHNKQLEKLAAEAEKAQKEAVKEDLNTAKKKAADAVCRVKTKTSTIISKIARKTLNTIIVTGSALVVISFLEKTATKVMEKRSEARQESADDFLDDLFGDSMDFEESVDTTDDDSDIQAFNEAVDEIYEDMFAESTSSKYDESYDFDSSDFDELFDI